MDESWKMKMGMHQLPNYSARRSTEEETSHRRKSISDDPLNPEDFTDVFGGPPRTVLSRQFSTGACPRSSVSSSTSFLYEEIFRPANKAAPVVKRSGRILPEFKIPGESSRRGDDRRNRENNSFYSDMFGCDNERVVRSRSRSKTSSSSVLSSEELSPLCPAISGGVDVSSFASKLRPINVRSKWSSTKMGHEDPEKQKKTPVFTGKQTMYSSENICIENIRNYPFGTSRRNTSPETISMEPISDGSTFRVSTRDLEVNSPSSPVSSICQSEKNKTEDGIMRRDDMEEEDEVMSSYVIEINSDKEGISESNGVDEAIAWAKDQFQSYCSESSSKWGTPKYENEKPIEEQRDKWAAEEDSQQFETEVEIEMNILEEKIRLWSNGKGADIRLLLSSLHHILWPNSGWHAIPVTNIIDSSQVKKAYQKARLCLHPDKLQQRGAIVSQKYIAERAFSVLQDAWASFISEDH